MCCFEHSLQKTWTMSVYPTGRGILLLFEIETSRKSKANPRPRFTIDSCNARLSTARRQILTLPPLPVAESSRLVPNVHHVVARRSVPPMG